MTEDFCEACEAVSGYSRLLNSIDSLSSLADAFLLWPLLLPLLAAGEVIVVYLRRFSLVRGSGLDLAVLTRFEPGADGFSSESRSRLRSQLRSWSSYPLEGS